MEKRSLFMLVLVVCVAAGTSMSSHPSREITGESRTLSVRIDRPLAPVYEFLVDPANWNQWAFGLGKSLRRSGSGWIADSADGIVKVQFTPRNAFAVLDHTVIRSSGAEVHVP